MIFINALRMIVDLSFYFYFAEFAASKFGKETLLPYMLLLCLIFGICVYFKRKVFFLPVIILLLPGISGKIFLVPAVLYVTYLLYKEVYGLSWDRQEELFSVSWKVFLGAGIFICLATETQILIERCLPVAFLSLVASILLLRSLRHEPEVYQSFRYQFLNSLLFGGILLCAWFCSRDFVFHAIGNFFQFCYMNFFYPILSLLLMLLMTVLHLFLKLFHWLNLSDIELESHQVGGESEGVIISDFDQTITQSGILFEKVLIGLLVIGLVVAAIFLFRWLLCRAQSDGPLFSGISSSKTTENLPKKKTANLSTVLQIRKQYRKFLKLYQFHGGKIKISDTSDSIVHKSENFFHAQDVVDEIRQIYIKARYGDSATKSDLKRIKQLNQLLKQ